MISNQSLTCPKGTSLTFEIDMDTGSDLTGATAQWALAESWFDQAKVYLTKTGGADGLFINQDGGVWKITVNLAPTDTLDVPSGLLYHDCKVLLQSGDVEDVANGPFSLDPSVNILETNAPITRNISALQTLGVLGQTVPLTVSQLVRNLLATQSLGGLGQASTVTTAVSATAVQALSGVGQAATISGAIPAVSQTDFLSISSLPAAFALSRATTGTRFNSSGILVTEAINAARFDFDPATLTAKGLLIEEERTNIILNSNNFSGGGWSPRNFASVGGSGNVSPDGSADATTLTVIAATGSKVAQGLISDVAAPNSLSVWARVTSGIGKTYITAQGASTGWSAGETALAGSLATSWQRLVLVCPNPTDEISIGNTTNDSDASLSVEDFGAQIEAGPFATSYIPTTTAPITRSVDTLSSNAPLTGYLAAGPSVWEFQDEATGVISRVAYAAGAFDWPVNKWYRSMGVYPAGTDTSSHMTVGSPY